MGVLIAILIVAGRVFNTAQQVSNVGAATADVMQEAVAIERRSVTTSPECRPRVCLPSTV